MGYRQQPELSPKNKWMMDNVFKYKKNGFYIDVGANNGIALSTTEHLEVLHEWTGICIEADDKCYEQLMNNRDKEKNAIVNACVWDEDGKDVEFVCQGMGSGVKDFSARWNEERLSVPNVGRTFTNKKTKSFLTILNENECPKVVDFLSIDIEGSEEKIISYAVLNEYKFSCILVEIYKDCRPQDNYPKTVVHDVLKENGYKMINKFGAGEYAYILSSDK